MTQELTTFAALKLSDALLQALAALNFTTPSPIQAQTIPILLQGRDLIGQAQTGTGKTAAFALPILQRLDATQKKPQALVLAPTRELAIQVAEHFESLSAHQKGTRVVVLCGGQDYRPQLKALRDGAAIVVGTPGRILDHLERKTLDLSELRTLVLDEADEMLRMGFIEDVETILAKLPQGKQIALFSATMPSRIRQIANSYLTDPVSVEIRMETATVKSIEQRFLFASQFEKPSALLRVLAVEQYQGVIVFVRTKSSSDEVAALLQQYGYRAMAIHGDITQALRERIISQFRQGAIDILVATDVAARGLDVERVTHVINYDMAHDCETYVHRIGRTGRAGRCGVTILFVTPKESRMLGMIERHTRERIIKIVAPTDSMIQKVRQEQFMTNITERLTHAHLNEYRQLMQQYLDAHPDVSVVDVSSALALLLNQDKSWQQTIALPKAPREVTPSASSRERPSNDARGNNQRPRRKSDQAFSPRPFDADRPRFGRDSAAQERYRLDVGRLHGAKPSNIVGAIANEAGLSSRDITGLKIHDDYSVVCLPKDMSKNALQGLTKAWVCGRQLKLTTANAG